MQQNRQKTASYNIMKTAQQHSKLPKVRLRSEKPLLTPMARYLKRLRTCSDPYSFQSGSTTIPRRYIRCNLTRNSNPSHFNICIPVSLDKLRPDVNTVQMADGSIHGIRQRRKIRSNVLTTHQEYLDEDHPSKNDVVQCVNGLQSIDLNGH
ncbi:hypothetical protein WICPIJ_008546 [Wickerhamomyces pijperi]|uniref:Uncharacterized protein n=1 Tax=Wickerhamomyces pijperi TaxID=599730 RepID=A0A9P8PY45_WICPI|nr:hypothetical protein WICPIJ_008546 [Wickerhamomyces pijperi]